MASRAGPYRNIGAPPGLRPARYYAGNLFCTDGEYVYGNLGTGAMQRLRIGEWTAETRSNWSSDFTEGGLTIANFNNWHIAPDGSWLVIVGYNPGPVYYLYRSTDAGDNWSTVRLRLGNDGSLSDFRTLGRNNMVNVTLTDGTKAILLGEYNGTTGTDNWLKVYISTDNGDTWSDWWHINDATRNFRHVHGIHQSPENGDIYVCFGDLSNEAAAVKGPATSSWSAIDDLGAAAIDATAGYSVQFGAQRDRPIDFFFRRGNIAYGSDTTTTSEDGFFKYRSDLSTTAVQTTEGGGYFDSLEFAGAPMGLQLRNGKMFAFDYVRNNDTSGVPVNRRIWASGDGEAWSHVANWQMNRDLDDVFASHVFELPNGQVCIGGRGMPNAVVSGATLESVICDVEHVWNGTVNTVMPESPA